MVGKTSLGKQYVDKTFSSEYKPTLGVDLYYKTYSFDQYDAHVLFWDMSGFKQFTHLRRQYFQGFDGAIIAFDVTRALNIDGTILPWIYDVLAMQKQSNTIPFAVLGNKSDLDIFKKVRSDEVETKVLDSIKNQLTIDAPIKYFQTSALTGENVDDSFNWLIEQSTLSNVAEGTFDS